MAATTTAKKTTAKKATTKKAAAAAAPTATPRKKTPARAATGALAGAPEFHAEYPVADMKPHPKNPRRRTEADPEMVASIQEHGVLEPIVIGPDGTVVMGNRRRDGLVKAKKKTGPVIIRHDLDTAEKQLEVAIVENLHRENLTPIEEAEAFAELRDTMKYSQAKIATKTGRPIATVRDRLKLLKLDKSAQDRIHEGQLTLTDALDLVAFDDDPKTQKVLAKAAVEGSNFKYKLEQEKQKRTKRLKVEAWVTELEGLGAEVVTLPKNWQQYMAAPDGMRSLGQAGQTWGELRDVSLADLAKKMHKGCLGYVVKNDTYEGQVLRLFCTDDSAHAAARSKEADVLTKAEKERQAENERRDAEFRARQENDKAAARVRVAAVMASIGPGLKLDVTVTNVLRTLLPTLIHHYAYEHDFTTYHDALDIPEDQRFDIYSYQPDMTTEDAKLQAHLGSLASGAPYMLIGSLFALLLQDCESSIKTTDEPIERSSVRHYFELLTESLGHQLSDVDEALLAAAQEPVEAEVPVAPPLDEDGELQPHHPKSAGPEYACEICDQPVTAEIHDVDEDQSS